jgi:hypothetical protein
LIKNLSNEIDLIILKEFGSKGEITMGSPTYGLEPNAIM